MNLKFEKDDCPTNAGLDRSMRHLMCEVNGNMNLRIRHCLTSSDSVFAKLVARDYMDWLSIDLTFQNVAKEFTEFSTMYGPPDGAYLLGFVDNDLDTMKVCEGRFALSGLNSLTRSFKK